MGKLFIFIVLLFGVLSCHQPKNDHNDILIIGKWNLYEAIAFQNNDDSATVLCNNCPEITFVKNHTGFIRRPDKILLYFNWEFDEGKLIIKHTELKVMDHILNDGSYKIVFSAAKFQEITLSDPVKSIKYILRR